MQLIRVQIEVKVSFYGQRDQFHRKGLSEILGAVNVHSIAQVFNWAIPYVLPVCKEKNTFNNVFFCIMFLCGSGVLSFSFHFFQILYCISK